MTEAATAQAARGAAGNAQAPAGTWRLVVDGAVRRRLDLDLADLARMAGVDLRATVECRSKAATSGTWTGPALAAVIEAASPLAGATHLVAEGADGHTHVLAMDFSQPLPGLVALALDGDLLPPQRGGPLRLLVPGPGGKRSVKWLTRLTVERGPA